MSADGAVFPETEETLDSEIRPEIRPCFSVKVVPDNDGNDKAVTVSDLSTVELPHNGLDTLTHGRLCDLNVQEQGHPAIETSSNHCTTDLHTEPAPTIHLPIDTHNARSGSKVIPGTVWTGSDRQRVGIVMARNLLDDKSSQLYVSARLAECQHKDDVCPDGADTMANPPQSAFSPGGESNPDSCYDSDASSVSSRRDSTPYTEIGIHSDVSRTTSDTLAAEYAEVDPNVKTHLSIEVPSADRPEQTHPGIRRKTSAHRTDSGGDLMSNQEYAAKVEFALRLGYTESQTQAALCKVGYRASEDTLLGELVQAGSEDTSDTDSEDETTSCDPQEARDTRFPEQEDEVEDSEEDNLRNIVIDGSNVAMSHGTKDVFSCRGIKLAVDWFKDRGHKDVTVFVPTWRKEMSRPDNPITDQEILKELEAAGALVFTPARRVPGGKRITCYDDRYIIKLAAETGGIVVSNDNYRDLAGESPEYKRVIEERLLMYSFVSDRFMPPDDPLGRHGPGLDDFLHKTPVGNKTQAPVCPYGKKCTYGNKCKFYHPERGSVPLKSVTERIAEQARSNLKEVKERGKLGAGDPKQRSVSSDSLGAKKSLTRTQSLVPGPQKMSLTRTKSVTTAMMSSMSTAGQRSGLDLSTVKPEARDVGMFVPTGTDSQEYHRYNDKLSELRVRIEQADLQEKDQDDLIKRHNVAPSRGLVGLKHNSDPVVRQKPSQHWSVMHESLRATHSDPSKPYSYDSPVTGGHLALAKKLSDEGKDDSMTGKLLGRGLSPNRQSPLIMTGEDGGHPVVRAKSSFPNSKAKHVSTQGKHQALQRQLSLTGADDSRLKQGSNWYSPAPGIRENPQVLSSQPWAAPTSHEPLERNLSFPLSRQDRSSTQVDQRQQQLTVEETRSPQTLQRMVSDSNVPQRSPKFPRDNLQGHQPIQRLGSAPMMPSGEGRTPSVRFHGIPQISRQNSTSDPQLNAVNLEPPPGNWNQVPDMHRDMLLRSLQTGPVPQHLMKVHFGPGPQAAGLQQKPHFLLPQNVATGFPNMSALAAQQAGAPFYPQGPTSVATSVRAPLPGYYMTRHTESPVPMMMSPNQDLTRAASPSNQAMDHVALSPRSTFPTPTASSSSMHNPQTIPQNMAFLSRGGPHPVPANHGQMGQSHDRVDLSDRDNPRHDLYYHLCHLFKEDEVRRVLEEHPDESDPQKLCKYLI